MDDQTVPPRTKAKRGRPFGSKNKKFQKPASAGSPFTPAAKNRPLHINWTDEQLRRGRAFPVIEQEGADLFSVPVMIVRQWINTILNEWVISTKAQENLQKTRIVVALEELYNTAMVAGDMRAAITAMDRLCKLLGLMDGGSESDSGASGAQAFRSADAIRDRMDELMQDPTVQNRLAQMSKVQEKTEE